MRTLALFLLIALSCQCLKGQQLAGFVQDDGGKPLANASVALKNARDSSVVKLSISDTNGRYAFPAVNPGRYFITVTRIGYAPQSSAGFDMGPEAAGRAPDIRLKPVSHRLKAAVVETGRPLVEVRNDRVILNVEGNINAIGSDALELLRKSPGVTIDKDNNLALGGIGGVQVHIDGRPTYLSGAALTAWLQTLPSAQVASIELITHPSSREDAAGSAGIINIRLKKNSALGTNLSLSAGYNIGTYGKNDGALSFNHRDRRFNLYGDYSYHYSNNGTVATMYRVRQDTSFNQQAGLVTMTGTHSYRAGLDWSVDNRNMLGLVISGSSSLSADASTSSTPIVYLPANRTERLLLANNHTDGSRDNINMDVNYRYADSGGRQLDIDFDYGVYHLRSNQLQPNNYYDSTGTMLLYSDDYDLVSPTDISIRTGKADYQTRLAKGRFGFGWKSSFVSTSNVFQEYDLYPGGKQQDSLGSNDFAYSEAIHALYVDYKRTLKGWVLQGGLRAENTWSRGTSTGYKGAGRNLSALAARSRFIPYDSSFTRDHTDLFPNISVTWNGHPADQWTAAFSRRIDRPAYQDLNPFEFKIDDYTFYRGNTRLLPQYTNAVSVTYLHAYKLSVSLTYSHTQGLFTVLADTTGGSRMVDERENLASQDVANLTAGYPFSYKWYSFYTSVTGIYSVNKADFGPGRTIDLAVFNTTVYSQHSCRLGRGWTGQISGYYTSPSIWQATLRSRPLWSLDAGLEKTLFEGDGKVRLSVTDIFDGLRWSATSEFAGQSIRTSGGYESRLLKLYFNWRFGNKQLKAARRHSNGDEDENKRVGAGSSGTP
ncbi:MAG TPA: TonB-dependent receptor [Puia sp.]|nr:TonB-dependent receptor [Puia sp.]